MKKFLQLKKIQPIEENIWIVLSRRNSNWIVNHLFYLKENNSFSKIIFEIGQFSNVGKSSKFKILRI